MNTPATKNWPCTNPQHEVVTDCLRMLERGWPPSEDSSRHGCICERLKINIVRLRRHKSYTEKHGRNEKKDAHVSATWNRFRDDVYGHANFLVQHLNSRWLVSVLDTLVDYGDPVERRNALLVVLIVSWERFAAATDARGEGRALWDGLTAMSTEAHADGHRNLFRRLAGTMKETPVVEAFFRTIIKRCCEQPTFTLSRLDKVSRRDIVADIGSLMGCELRARNTQP